MAKTSPQETVKRGRKATTQPRPHKTGRKTTKETTAKEAAPNSFNDMSPEELVIANFATLTNVLETLGKTLDTLVQKTEGMAHHIIATEEVLAELVATNGIDLARVNQRIRAKIGSGTGRQVDSSKTIDIAAGIASPAGRRRKI